MALGDALILLAGLMEITLPAHTIRLCDGGFVDWPTRGMFTAEDSIFGTIGAVEAVGEAINDEAPGGRLTLLPPADAGAADLFQPEAQGSPIRFWIAELDGSTAAVLGTPELLFDGLVDTLELAVTRQERSVALEFTAAAERLFMIREGNVLSPRFHKTLWPGEKGLDFVTGHQTRVPWGLPGSNSFGVNMLAFKLMVEQGRFRRQQ